MAVLGWQCSQVCALPVSFKQGTGAHRTWTLKTILLIAVTLIQTSMLWLYWADNAVKCVLSQWVLSKQLELTEPGPSKTILLIAVTLLQTSMLWLTQCSQVCALPVSFKQGTGAHRTWTLKTILLIAVTLIQTSMLWLYWADNAVKCVLSQWVLSKQLELTEPGPSKQSCG